MRRILVTGGRSGLGLAIVKALDRKAENIVMAYDTADGYSVNKPDVGWLKELDVLVNCAGVNIINWFEDVTEDEWHHVMGTNAMGIMKMTQACLPLLKASRGTVLNIVSNAAHMPMRCSLAYNASKAAALMITKQLARELTPKYGITVFSVSPNKLKGTGMSDSIDKQVMRTRGWDLEQTQKYQLQSLLTGKETPPKTVAEFIAYLLQDKAHHECLSGCDMQYGL